MTEPEDKLRRKSKDQKDQMKASTASSAKPPVYDIIGRRLREFYDDVAHQPVPDRFAELLNQLESKTPPKPKN
jgi:Anti-sigma factor NepR